MTADPITAVLDQLAEHTEQIIRLDAREAEHFTAITGRLTELTDLITGIGQTLQDDTPALTRLEALDRQVTDLAAQLTGRRRSRRLPARSPRHHGGSSPPTNARNRSPGCGPGSSRSTGPATVTWPPPSAPAGPPTTCACTAWTSCPACGRSCTCSHRTTGLLSGQAEYQARILPALAAQLMTETSSCGHPRNRAPGPAPVERAMTDAILRQALAYARRGWPVFPCLPGQKIPATRHGFRDATTDEQQITDWFGRSAGWNLAIATGAPGPDVLDVDQHGPAGNGYAAFTRLRRAGLADGAAAYVRTPSGGMHAYFTGSDQHNGRLPSHHLDFRSAGGYILAPPSQVDGQPYQLIKKAPRPRRSGLGRGHPAARTPAAAAPSPATPGSRPRPDPPGPVGRQPARRKPQRGLFWAANRALDADHAADLSPLAVAARQAGLGDKEITRTLDSARRTGQNHAHPRDRQAEAGAAGISTATQPAQGTTHDPAPGRPGSHRRHPRHDPRHRAACPRRRGRNPAAAPRPARDGPRLGPHRPRPRRPRDDHPRPRPRQRHDHQPAAAQCHRRPLRRLVGQARPRTHPRRTRRRQHRPPPRPRRQLVRRRRPRRRPARHPRLPAPQRLAARHRHRHRPRHLPARRHHRKRRA